MIRLVKRQLIIPRGDTGSFAIPTLTKDRSGVAIFSIRDPLTQTLVFQKEITSNNDYFTIEFDHSETVNLPIGNFLWDIKYYINPVYANGKIVDGEEIDSYYAGFSLPICEIRQTGDSLLVSDVIGSATMRADQIKIISDALIEIANAKAIAIESAEHAAEIAQNIIDNTPTKLSELENDVGYITDLPIERRSTAEWNAANDYIPPANTILFYTDTNQIKISDGLAYAADLPFVTDAVKNEILTTITEHTGNTNIHVNTEDKTFWNNKLNCELEGELLILNRN